MYIDFIKWKAEKADGFEFIILNGEPALRLPSGNAHRISWMKKHGVWKDVCPLLLQRAIEGVNREYEYEINIIKGSCIEVGHGNEWDGVYNDKDPDQNKEQALKYIYEQEKKDE